MLDVFHQRRTEIASQVRSLISVRGPRTAQQKLQLQALLDEADALEGNITSEHERRQCAAFNLWLRGGRDAMPDSQYRLLHEQRDMTDSGLGTGAASGAGVFVPVETERRITSAMRDYSDLLRVSNLVDAKTGRSHPYPVDNDAAIEGEGPIGEAAQVTTQDIGTPGQVILGAYKFSSRLVLTSNEFLADSSELDFPSYFAKVAGVRLARVISRFATTGTGVNQPTGFMSSATMVNAGVAVGASGNDGVSGANTLGLADFATLEGGVDVAYRSRALWMMHPSTLLTLRRQTDKQGRALFPGLQNSPDGVNRIFNREVLTNPAMDELQAHASSPVVTRKPLALVDFTRFTIRRLPLVVWRLNERFAEMDKTAFLALQRVDCDFTDRGACGAYIETAF